MSEVNVGDSTQVSLPCIRVSYLGLSLAVRYVAAGVDDEISILGPPQEWPEQLPSSGPQKRRSRSVLKVQPSQQSYPAAALPRCASDRPHSPAGKRYDQDQVYVDYNR